jgi:hypothetical protein
VKPLLGVVIRFQDLDQAVKGVVRAAAFRTEHHNVTVGGTEAHEGQDAGGVHCFISRLALAGDGDVQVELAGSLGKDGGGAGVKAYAAGDGCGAF